MNNQKLLPISFAIQQIINQCDQRLEEKYYLLLSLETDIIDSVIMEYEALAFSTFDFLANSETNYNLPKYLDNAEIEKCFAISLISSIAWCYYLEHKDLMPCFPPQRILKPLKICYTTTSVLATMATLFWYVIPAANRPIDIFSF